MSTLAGMWGGGLYEGGMTVNRDKLSLSHTRLFITISHNITHMYCTLCLERDTNYCTGTERFLVNYLSKRRIFLQCEALVGETSLVPLTTRFFVKNVNATDAFLF